MELSKKTTILLSPAMHRQLTRLARQRGLSLGELIRRACAKEYGLGSPETRRAAVRELAAFSLPVGPVGEMEHESVPDPASLLP